MTYDLYETFSGLDIKILKSNEKSDESIFFQDYVKKNPIIKENFDIIEIEIFTNMRNNKKIPKINLYENRLWYNNILQNKKT